MEKRIARYALLVSLAMVLSWLESLIVFPGLLPGMKVGLTNLVVVFALYRASLRDAARAADLAELDGVTELRLVVNRVAPKIYRQMHATVDDVMDGVCLPLLGIVPEDAGVTLAAAAGVPLILHGSDGAAEACLHIARRLCGRRTPLLKIK